MKQKFDKMVRKREKCNLALKWAHLPMTHRHTISSILWQSFKLLSTTFWDMHYFLVVSFGQVTSADRQMDRKLCIWANRAYAQSTPWYTGVLKNELGLSCPSFRLNPDICGLALTLSLSYSSKHGILQRQQVIL